MLRVSDMIAKLLVMCLSVKPVPEISYQSRYVFLGRDGKDAVIIFSDAAGSGESA